MFIGIQQRLSSIITNKNNNNIRTQYRQSIKQQLLTLGEYISQQFLKLSAYYQTKLQYQCQDYEQQINMLKQQIQRQYKVIGLMKNQLEDLVVMVNLQRQHSPQQQHQQTNNNIDEESVQWRIRRGDSQSTNEHITNQHNLQSSTQPLQTNTIFGLQVIAQQQTQRTLISVCDQDYDQTYKCDQNYDHTCKQSSTSSPSSKTISQSPQMINMQSIQGDNNLQDRKQEQKTIENNLNSNNNPLVSNYDNSETLVNKQYQQNKNRQNDKSSQSNHQKQQQQAQSYQQQQQRQHNQPSSNNMLSPQNNATQYQYDELIFNQQKQQSSDKIIKKKPYSQSKNNAKSSNINKHSQSIKPNIYYTHLQQFQQFSSQSITNINNQQKLININNKPQNFISNPFSKNKSISSKQQYISKNCEEEKNEKLNNKQRQLSPKLFLQQFRKSFIDDNQQQQQQKHKQQKQQEQRSIQRHKNREKQDDVMSILQMIAMKGSTAKSTKRSSKYHKQYDNSTITNRESQTDNNSRSRRKSQNQSSLHRNSQNQCSIVKMKSSSHIKSINISKQRKRISTEQSSQRKQQQQYQSYSHHNNNAQSSSQYNNNTQQYKLSRVSFFTNNNNRLQTEQLSNPNNQCNYGGFIQNNSSPQYNSIDQFRSLQTTFGKPVSFQFLQQITNNTNINNEYHNNEYHQVDKMHRKMSAGSNNININKILSNPIDKSPQSNHNYSSKVSNKQNQRQRRMSQKIPNSSSNKNINNQYMQKKQSTKFIKNKPPLTLNNVSTSIVSKQQCKQQQQSPIVSMLQSHLQNSNKFLIGNKKQQIKYDGQRITYGHMTLKHGHGVLYYSNGLIYQGQFHQNKRQGYGLLKFNHVQLYSGEWLNDQLNGKGKIRNCAIINKKKKQSSQKNTTNAQNNNSNWSMGNGLFMKWISYCGQFRSNRFEGEGTLYLQGGQKFVGWFRNGVADGQGSLYKQVFSLYNRKNGEVQQGRWKNNILIEKYQMQLE